MPIDIDRFEKGQKPLAERILDELAKKPEQAFTGNEVIALVEGVEADVAFSISLLFDFSGVQGGKTKVERYRDAIDELVAAGKVRKADIEGVTYFAIARSETAS